LIPRSAQYIFEALSADLNAGGVSDVAMMSTAVPFETPPSPKRGVKAQNTPGSSGRKKNLGNHAKSAPAAQSPPQPTPPPASNRKPGPSRRASVAKKGLAAVSKATPKPKTKVLCTFCEVYNEQVYDLLNLSEDTLPVRWDAKHKTFSVPDLLSVECNTVEEFMMVVREGG
jgi:Kinesin motor domain